MEANYEAYIEFKRWDKEFFGKVELGAYYDCEIERAFGTTQSQAEDR